MQMFQLMSALLLSQAAAFQLQGAAVPRALASARSTNSVVMGEASTNKENEWKFVKGINDYGKEQTYMYLGAKDNSEDGDSFLSKPIIDLGAYSFILKPYFIALFTPFALCVAYLVSERI